MSLSPPFIKIEPKKRTRYMWLAIGLVLLMSFIMTKIGAPLITSAAPAGIVSFEFAGTAVNAQTMIDSWDTQAKIHAGLSMGLDFLYPLIYAMAISLAVVVASGRFQGWLHKVGAWLAWGVWLAAGLDYIENIALIQLLLGSTNDLWATVAYWAASIKFLLIILGILYALLGGMHAIIKREANAEIAYYTETENTNP